MEAIERIEAVEDLRNPDLSDHLSRYLYATAYVDGRRVLDAGTGLGYGAAMLGESGAREVVAIDIDGPTIQKARRTFPGQNLHFLVDNSETLENLDGQFDVICSFENIEHLSHPERFVESASRLLADDGVLLCSSPDRASIRFEWKDGKPSNKFHMNEWYRDEFQTLFSVNFEDVVVRSQVISHAFFRREEIMSILERHFVYLWSAPSLRLTRALGRLFGKRREWKGVRELATLTVADFPIVPHVISSAIGRPFCHYAVCRRPRR